MNYIRITKENIDREHICCAMSGKQSIAKKEWLRQRFEEGLVFYRSEERGKCFIEYIPAENAWVPIMADGWLYINCLWVSGSMKGHGYSNDLLEECIRDARAQEKNGLCILCAEGRKREFLADPKFLAHKGFRVADISDCGIDLMVLPLVPNAEPPRFRECAKHPAIAEAGFVLYYTDQCPYTYYWVPRVQEAAKEHDIPFKGIHITDKESAQNVPAPVTTYALFRDSKFLTQSIQSKNFWRWLESGTESSYIGKSSIHVRIRGAYPRSRRSASILLFQSAVSGSQARTLRTASPMTS